MPDLHAIPKLSLIVPVYGVEDYVADCIDSILDADGFADHCELIVIDDGSLDGSMAIVEQRCAGLSNVTIVSQANAGLGAARNAGLVQARGRYVWFIDSDDEIYPNAVRALITCIETLQPDIIAFEFDTIGGTLDRGSYLAAYNERVNPIAFMTSGRPPSPVQFYAFSRDFLFQKQLRFQSGIYHEDALFTALTLVAANSLTRLTDSCYRYRLRSGSIMSLSRPNKHLADMLFIAGELAEHASAEPYGSPPRRALAREIGFALSSARHYAVRTARKDWPRAVSLKKLISIGVPWSRHFTTRAFVNYVRLLGLATWRCRTRRI